MSARDLEAWMWSEAVRRLDHADRMRQQFFRRSGPPPRREWEPPVDVFETADAIWITVALPGVSADRMTHLELTGDAVIVAGERPLPAPEGDALLHRLEIPHGRFERRIALPARAIAIARHELVDGCLYLTLRKR